MKSRLQFVLVAGLMSAAFAQPAESDRTGTVTLVAVSADGQNCAIKTVRVSCKGITKHLLEQLHLPLNASIGVTNDGRVEFNVLQRVVADLKQAGFTDVQSVKVGFITEPPTK